MVPKDVGHLFKGLKYMKTAGEIVHAASAKAELIEGKIAERESRIGKLREEYQIDDAALVQLLQAARKNALARTFRYSVSGPQTGGGPKMEEREIGAGVVNNLLTENDFIESERDQLQVLQRIVRNLKPIDRHAENGTWLPDQGFVMSADDLDFLGF